MVEIAETEERIETMSLIANISIVIASVIGMEIFAWAIHKYVMHGPGWGWHESHHTETQGLFEKNDLYAVVFSFIAAGFFIIGSMGVTWLWYVGLGLTIYGILYASSTTGSSTAACPFPKSQRRIYETSGASASPASCCAYEGWLRQLWLHLGRGCQKVKSPTQNQHGGARPVLAVRTSGINHLV